MFRVLAVLSTVLTTTVSIINSAELLAVPSEHQFHVNSLHEISNQGNPWITGPKNNKYQFYVGRQSWLVAREHCLAQNSDLVVIEDAEDLNWILSHYAPVFPHSTERLIQVGFYVDSQNGIRDWHWTNQKSLNTSALHWISGEPFDHANGHERCAVIHVNDGVLDDIDCDLEGSEAKMYRFICQRSHEAHVKHEELNNPLWKKLQDILNFFDINRLNTDNSYENKTRSGEGKKDYWEMVKSANITDVDNSLNGTKISATTMSTEETIEGSGEEATEVTQTPIQIYNAKIFENAIVADELLVNNNFQKNDSEEKPITIGVPATLLKKKFNIETASVKTNRTTKPDFVEKRKKITDQIYYVDILQKHIDKFEKVVNAVEHMMNPLFDGSDEEDSDLGSIAESQNENNTEVSISEIAEITANDIVNMKEDFQQAELEVKEHPGINSGNFVAIFNKHQKNIELCENNDVEATNSSTRAQKVAKFLTSLQQFLNQSSSKLLKDLLDESKLIGKSLLERIDEVVMEETAKQIQKMIEIQGKLADRIAHKRGGNQTTISTTAVTVENENEEPKKVTEETATKLGIKVMEPTANDDVEAFKIAIQAVTSKITTEVELEALTMANTEKLNDKAEGVEAETSVTENINVKEIESTAVPTKTVNFTASTDLPTTTLLDSAKTSKENNLSGNFQVTKENVKEVSKKSQSELKKAETKKQPEHESLFPTPDFTLIKPGQKIPEKVLKSVQEEASKIKIAYDEFNSRMDTSKLVQHIQEKEANGVLKNKPMLDLLPLSSSTGQRDLNKIKQKALLELEKMFIDLAKTFQEISQE